MSKFKTILGLYQKALSAWTSFAITFLKGKQVLLSKSSHYLSFPIFNLKRKVDEKTKEIQEHSSYILSQVNMDIWTNMRISSSWGALTEEKENHFKLLL